MDFRKEFEEIYAAHLHKVRFVAFNYLGSKAEAECVAQEIFITLWNRIEEIDLGQPTLPYLITLTRNRCLNILKARKAKYREKFTNQAIMDAINIQAIERTDAAILSQELKTQIEASLQKMSPTVRETFLLHRNKELKYSEMADHYGVSVKTIEARMMSALRILRKGCKEFLVLIVGLIETFL